MTRSSGRATGVAGPILPRAQAGPAQARQAACLQGWTPHAGSMLPGTTAKSSARCPGNQSSRHGANMHAPRYLGPPRVQHTPRLPIRPAAGHTKTLCIFRSKWPGTYMCTTASKRVNRNSAIGAPAYARALDAPSERHQLRGGLLALQPATGRAHALRMPGHWRKQRTGPCTK